MLEKKPKVSMMVEMFPAGDPPIDVYTIEVSNETGVFPETFGSIEQLRAFMRGVQAGCSMFGVYISHADIPTQYSLPLVRKVA